MLLAMPLARLPGVLAPLSRHLALALALAAPLLAPATAGATCTTNAAPLGDGLTNVVCASTTLIVTPNPVDPNVAATFDGSGSTGPNGPGDIASYVWDFGDGTGATTSGSGADQTQHAYAQRGHYTATLTTKDASDVVIASSTPVDVYVSAMPIAVLVVPGGTLRPGVAYSFDASGSSAPGGSIAQYEWDWGDGSALQTTSTPTVQHTFASDGASTQVTLTVVNDVGLHSAPATQAIVVQDQLPVVQLSATPSTVAIGQQLTLSAAGSHDPDGAIVEYRWDLDANGSFETSTGTTPQVTAGGYPNVGPISLRVKVIDDSGEASIAAVNVTVVDPGGGGGGSGGSGGSGGAGGTHGGSGSGGGAGAGASTTAAFVLGLRGTPIQRLPAVLRRGVGLQALANRAGRGMLTLTISARDARTLHLASRRTRKPVVIGTFRIRLRAGKLAKSSVKLTRRAARALRHAHAHRLLRVTVHGALAAGTAHATALRMILLRR
jgi:PKD repeat protein